MAVKKRRITAEDLYRFETVSDPQISPDGRFIIFCVQRVDRKTEKKFTNLWLVSTRGGKPRQFTYGDQTDTHPRWSPDGKQIAFLSNRGDESQMQIYLIPIDGGEARPLTNMQGSFGSFEWSPDGRQLVCAFRKKDKEQLEREADERKKKLGVVARHITSLDYKFDGVGYLPKEKWHIWTINARTGKAHQLTEGDKYSETSPRWSPDGKQILFFSNRSERPDIDVHLDDIFVMPAEGGTFRKVETPPGPKYMGSFSPDGKWIAYLGREGKGDWWKNTRLWVVPVDGSAPARDLTGQYDVDVSSGTLTDTGDRPTLPPVWLLDGGRLYFHVTHHGETRLCSVAADGSDLQTVIDGGVVGGYSLDSKQVRLAYWFGDMMNPGQVWVRLMENGRSRQLTRFNTWLNRVDLGQIEEVWFKGPDNNDLQGWILNPPDFDPTKKYPSILEIHGGPWLQYGKAFMHEFFFLAAQDYVVYFTNPRGGQGYGEAHSRAIHRNWGRADYADVMAWADLVSQKPYIDTNRMGVTGGSYGGFMTTWIIGHTDRFKAAVAQRVVSNAISFWGSSDVGFLFEDPWSGKPPWEDLEKYWDQSPMKYIGNARTPTLVIHSEKDYRCAQEQGEQVYIALTKLGVDTELVLFPDSSHGLSRAGRTDRRIARLNHILRWFDKYLK
ncbi:MAG: S9 family peptidase [Chloroflexi bacterium]|nr:MAG: S9 family peptidase [Chloroflexota bacterium]